MDWKWVSAVFDTAKSSDDPCAYFARRFVIVFAAPCSKSIRISMSSAWTVKMGINTDTHGMLVLNLSASDRLKLTGLCVFRAVLSRYQFVSKLPSTLTAINIIHSQHGIGCISLQCWFNEINQLHNLKPAASYTKKGSQQNTTLAFQSIWDNPHGNWPLPFCIQLRWFSNMFMTWRHRRW